MADAKRAARESRAGNPTLVIMPQGSGYRVYAASDPSRIYEIREEDGRWRCTCPDFDERNMDVDWQCPHILAAVPHLAHASTAARASGSSMRIVPMAAATGDEQTEPPAASMLIRRSVSPDGRIDSVSVEFTLPVAGDSTGAIKHKALRTLDLQKEIVAHFLGWQNGNGAINAVPQPHPHRDNPNGSHHPNGHHPNGDNLSPARILDIGEVQGKWGPRLCLTFQVNGNRTRLFGSAKQLAARLAEAGYDYDPDALYSGLRLNLACKVLTEPSADGKYVNVGKLYPASPNGSAA